MPTPDGLIIIVILVITIARHHTLKDLIACRFASAGFPHHQRTHGSVSIRWEAPRWSYTHPLAEHLGHCFVGT